jgi:uncharacterized protein
LGGWFGEDEGELYIRAIAAQVSGVAVMYLADTNIFLEILLRQDKSELCKSFLKVHAGEIHISDFSLHSIGVILFRQKEEQTFKKFVTDIFPNVRLISLPKSGYTQIVQIKNALDLDFDDLYQYSICKYFDLRLITMDSDFDKIKEIEVEFL